MKPDVNNPLRTAVIIKKIIGERGVITCYSIYLACKANIIPVKSRKIEVFL